MSKQTNPIVHLRIYKGGKMTYDENQVIQNPNQLTKLKYGTLEWANFLKNLPTMGFTSAKVEKVLDEKTLEEIATPKHIAEEVANIYKAPVVALTADQKRIADLEAKLEAFTNQSKPKGIDLLGELKKEWASMTDAKPNNDWTVQDFQDAISDMKNAK
jgi:hypothetical protein